MSERVTRGVEAELRAAAAARWEPPPEVFLWRVRRCIEAMVYALLVDEKADVAQLGDKTLEELCRHDKLRPVLSKEARSHLDSLRQYGNAGTHFQLDGDVSDDSATIAANALVALVRWYFERRDRPLSDEVRAHLAALLDRERRLVPPWELARDRALARAASLERRLAESPTGRVGASTSDEDGAPAARWTNGPRATRWALVSGVLMVAAFAFGRFTRAPVASSAVIQTVTPAELPAPTPTSVTTPPVFAPAPVAAPVAVAAPAAVADAAAWSCDPGMRMVPAAGSASAFCIDPELVTTARYQQCVEARVCDPAARVRFCNTPEDPATRQRPANCVSLGDALRYCVWRHLAGGGIPTREDLTRLRVPWLHGATDTSEWTETAVDASDRVWVYAEPSEAWNRMSRATRRSDVSFRCVTRAE